MQKHDYIDLLKVNAAPVVALVVHGTWHLDDFVKITTIAAMLLNVGYTAWKWFVGWKRNKPLDTTTGGDE